MAFFSELKKAIASNPNYVKGSALSAGGASIVGSARVGKTAGLYRDMVKKVLETVRGLNTQQHSETKVTDSTAPDQNTNISDASGSDTRLNLKRKKRGISDLRIGGVNRG